MMETSLDVWMRKTTLEHLKKLADQEDADDRHRQADLAICNLLVSLGYADVVDAWHKVPKWFS